MGFFFPPDCEKRDPDVLRFVQANRDVVRYERLPTCHPNETRIFTVPQNAAELLCFRGSSLSVGNLFMKIANGQNHLHKGYD